MEDLSRYHTLLKDPARRKIIEALGSQEKMGFKELRQMLGLGVGTVYYHLDMLSGFLAQDKQRRYKLNERGRSLLRALKEGQMPPDMRINETFGHRLGKWLFLSPVFAKTAKPIRLLPISLFILALGALGSAYAKIDPALFFYLRDSPYGFSSIITLYFSNWIGLFLFAEVLSYVLYSRVANELQLFTCIGIATFPLAIFPYVFILTPSFLPKVSLAILDNAVQYLFVPLQVWSILLVSAAFCFGKGIRFDKAAVISLAAVYINIVALFLFGQFT